MPSHAWIHQHTLHLIISFGLSLLLKHFLVLDPRLTSSNYEYSVLFLRYSSLALPLRLVIKMIFLSQILS